MLLAQPVRTANCHLRAFGEALQINRTGTDPVLGGRVECSSAVIPSVLAGLSRRGGYVSKRSQKDFADVGKAFGVLGNE